MLLNHGDTTPKNGFQLHCLDKQIIKYEAVDEYDKTVLTLFK